MAFPDYSPGFTNSEGSTYPTELFAGEKDLVTQNLTAGAAVAQFQPVMMNSSGDVIPWDGTNFPGDGALTVLPVPMGIAAMAIASGDVGPVFVSGAFNGNLTTSPIDWPSGSSANTLLKRQRAFTGSGIIINDLKGAQTRMAIP